MTHHVDLEVMAPTVTRLQTQAHLLVRHMIAAGPYQPALLEQLPHLTRGSDHG